MYWTQLDPLQAILHYVPSPSSMNSLQIGSDVKQTSLAESTLAPASLPGERAPFSYQFFDSEKEMAKARTVFIKIMFQRTMLAVAAILAVCSIFWATMQKQPAWTLEGWIVVSVKSLAFKA